MNARPPLWSPDDPDNSRVAAELLEPRRDTNKARVLRYLRDREGTWVSGHELCGDVGGEEGKRRARELRAEGEPIEIRPGPAKGSWEYRYHHGVSGKVVSSWTYADEVVFLPGDEPADDVAPESETPRGFDALPVGCCRAACWCSFWIVPARAKPAVCAVCGVVKEHITDETLASWERMLHG